MVNTSQYITFIASVSIILILAYIIITISQFYGIDTSGYGVYIAFYLFIFISSLILPLDNTKI